MKNIEMRLHEEPFMLIKNGIKDIEYRLNDEKRKDIKVGDTITFYKRPEEKEMIKVEVIERREYKTLLEMYEDTFDRYLYQNYKTPEDAVLDTPYYSEDEVKKYGCVAIIFKKIS